MIIIRPVIVLLNDASLVSLNNLALGSEHTV